VLEAYGHCEVPAGCGGVVLRWRNPLAAVPLTVRLYTPVAAPSFLDGAELETGLVNVTPGPHVVAVALSGVNLSAGLIMFAALHEPRAARTPGPTRVTEQPVKVLSAGDGTWKFTLTPPAGDGWKSAGFHDPTWGALAAVDIPKLDWKQYGAIEQHNCAYLKAGGLGLPNPPKRKKVGDVWVRKVFEVPAPRLPDSSE
jgi:hypothetical protein